MTPKKQNILIVKKCKNCNNEFESFVREQRKYCSYDCYHEKQKDLDSGEYHRFHKLNYEKEKEICRLYTDKSMTALAISKLFDVNVSTIIRVVRKYSIQRTPKESAKIREMSNPGLAKMRSEQNIGRHLGEKSPRYKNGSSKWQFNVMQRDKYTCQDCGLQEREILEAHHIKPKKEYPELQFDISNGITLCPNCHKRRHIQMTKNGMRSKTYTNSRAVNGELNDS